MDPLETTSTPQSTPPEWFNQIPSTQQLPPVPSPSNPRRKFIIVSVVVTGVMLACIIIGSVLAYRMFAACLTADDYRELNGKALQDTDSFSPKDNFFTATLQYNNGTTTVADTQDNPDQAVLITKIAEFYGRHSNTRPIIITVSGGYATTDTKEAASKRISSLSAALVEKGVKESAIVSEEPSEIISDGELTADSNELKTARTYISLVASSTCTE